jgi:uncharacterized protein (DUF486 family)
MIAHLLIPLQTVGLPAAANCFMSFACYGRLRASVGKPWCVAAVCFISRSN